MHELALPTRWLPRAWPVARRRTWLALIAVVTLAHLFAVDGLVEDRFGWGDAERLPPRIEVTFVRELAQAVPPQAAPTPPPRARARRSPAAASAPEPAPAAPEAPPLLAIEPAPTPADLAAPPPLAELAATPALTSAGDAVAAASALAIAVASPAAALSASAPGVDWPPSTRLSYQLEGWYRGRLEGSAQVDWLRSGQRYQVHLETSFGPIMSRHITSEGELTPNGLAPRRFDGEQKVLFRATRRWTQRFGLERITLADGSEVAAPPGAQDEASQFVQLTWLFTTRPEMLQVGRTLVVPLALNRRVDDWIYDVVAEEVLDLPFGRVRTFHVKPRHEIGGGDLTPQIWFAPTLQYLPVRILLHQDAETFVDLKLQSPPLQAAPEAGPQMIPPTRPRGETP